MKKILFGLMALSVLSAFAAETEVDVKVKTHITVDQESGIGIITSAKDTTLDLPHADITGGNLGELVTGSNQGVAFQVFQTVGDQTSSSTPLRPGNTLSFAFSDHGPLTQENITANIPHSLKLYDANTEIVSVAPGATTSSSVNYLLTEANSDARFYFTSTIAANAITTATPLGTYEDTATLTVTLTIASNTPQL